MEPDEALTAMVCIAGAFLLGAGITLVVAWADIVRYRRIAKRWRDEARQQRIERRRAERIGPRSPVQQFNDRRADPRPLAYDPPVTRRYNDHPPMRPVPIVRSADDTQVIGRIDQTGDVT